MANKTSRGNIFWPYINDETSAREAAKQGWYASLISGGITLIMVVLGATSSWSLVDVGLLCLIGYGCLKMSRIAAILGLIYCIFNGIDKYIVHSTFGLMPLFAIFYINSIRGTYKFYEIKKSKITKA